MTLNQWAKLGMGANTGRRVSECQKCQKCQNAPRPLSTRLASSFALFPNSSRHYPSDGHGLIFTHSLFLVSLYTSHPKTSTRKCLHTRQCRFLLLDCPVSTFFLLFLLVASFLFIHKHLYTNDIHFFLLALLHYCASILLKYSSYSPLLLHSTCPTLSSTRHTPSPAHLSSSIRRQKPTSHN